MTSQGLQDWLDIATRDLCADARGRVCEEVKAHYAAAHDALLASGESVDVAAGALASLGSAKKARRRYARVLLTKKDEKYIAQLVAFPHLFIGSFGPVLCVFIGMATTLQHAVHILPSTAGFCVLAFCAAYVIWIRLRYRDEVRDLINRLNRIWLSIAVLCPFAMLLVGYGQYGSLSLAAYLGALALPLISLLTNIQLTRIGRKLAQRSSHDAINNGDGKRG